MSWLSEILLSGLPLTSPAPSNSTLVGSGLLPQNVSQSRNDAFATFEGIRTDPYRLAVNTRSVTQDPSLPVASSGILTTLGSGSDVLTVPESTSFRLEPVTVEAPVATVPDLIPLEEIDDPTARGLVKKANAVYVPDITVPVSEYLNTNGTSLDLNLYWSFHDELVRRLTNLLDRNPSATRFDLLDSFTLEKPDVAKWYSDGLEFVTQQDAKYCESGLFCRGLVQRAAEDKALRDLVRSHEKERREHQMILDVTKIVIGPGYVSLVLRISLPFIIQYIERLKSLRDRRQMRLVQGIEVPENPLDAIEVFNLFRSSLLGAFEEYPAFDRLTPADKELLLTITEACGDFYNNYVTQRVREGVPIVPPTQNDLLSYLQKSFSRTKLRRFLQLVAELEISKIDPTHVAPEAAARTRSSHGMNIVGRVFVRERRYVQVLPPHYH